MTGGDIHPCPPLWLRPCLQETHKDRKRWRLKLTAGAVALRTASGRALSDLFRIRIKHFDPATSFTFITFSSCITRALTSCKLAIHFINTFSRRITSLIISLYIELYLRAVLKTISWHHVGANRKRVCDFLLVRNSNRGPNFHRCGYFAALCARPDPIPIPPQF